MPEIEMAALAKKGVATVSDSRQESAVSAKAGAVKRGFSFEGFLII